jgi:hypothetical protein
MWRSDSCTIQVIPRAVGAPRAHATAASRSTPPRSGGGRRRRARGILTPMPSCCRRRESAGRGACAGGGWRTVFSTPLPAGLILRGMASSVPYKNIQAIRDLKAFARPPPHTLVPGPRESCPAREGGRWGRAKKAINRGRSSSPRIPAAEPAVTATRVRSGLGARTRARPSRCACCPGTARHAAPAPTPRPRLERQARPMPAWTTSQIASRWWRSSVGGLWRVHHRGVAAAAPHRLQRQRPQLQRQHATACTLPPRLQHGPVPSPRPRRLWVCLPGRRPRHPALRCHQNHNPHRLGPAGGPARAARGRGRARCRRLWRALPAELGAGTLERTAHRAP